MEHGSDHWAVITTFSDSKAAAVESPRLNFRRTRWDRVCEDLSAYSNYAPIIDTAEELERQTEEVTRLARGIAAGHTPEAKSSPYMKAWWDEELSMLRRAYTSLRNRAWNEQRGEYRQRDREAQVTIARRRFHTAVRDKKRQHWQCFLEEPDNIWKAARYLRPRESTFGNIPILVDNQVEVEDNKDKAEVLLRTFFPPTPDGWGTAGSQHSSLVRDNPDVTVEEIGYAVHRIKPWKAPGTDGLPHVVWREVWSVLKRWIHAIFSASLRLGSMPAPWRIARILPLRKPDKPDYTIPEAYRPISLLSTLGKILELVVARRLSYWAETHNLLPTNQFGARPRRSCEQALVILTESIKDAWRQRKVLSLVSFDVKGAYNGVPREVMADRLSRRGIPSSIVRWVQSFCSGRRATVVVNGFETEAMDVAFPGLPQGSPLSPVLYIFFNADLVDTDVDNRKGAIGFVDDYTRWTIGNSVEENMAALQHEVVPRALQWAKDLSAPALSCLTISLSLYGRI